MTGTEAFEQLPPADQEVVTNARLCSSHGGLAEALFGGRGPGLDLGSEETQRTQRGAGLEQFRGCAKCKEPEEGQGHPGVCEWVIRPPREDGKPPKPSYPCAKPLPCPDHPHESDDETAAQMFPNRVPKELP